MAEFDPYGAHVSTDLAHVRAETPHTSVGSHHLGHDTPSGASESQGSHHFDFVGDVPSTPSAVQRESSLTDGSSVSGRKRGGGGGGEDTDAPGTETGASSPSGSELAPLHVPDLEALEMIEADDKVAIQVRTKASPEEIGEPGSPENDEFCDQFKDDLAKACKLDPSRIVVRGADPVTGLIDFEILPPEHDAETPTKDAVKTIVDGVTNKSPAFNRSKSLGDLDRDFGVDARVLPRESDLPAPAPPPPRRPPTDVSAALPSDGPRRPPSDVGAGPQSEYSSSVVSESVVSGSSKQSESSSASSAPIVLAPIEEEDEESVDMGAEAVAEGSWPPEVLTLDYTPVTSPMPTTMQVPLRQRRAGRAVRLVCGIAVHDEPANDVNHTLTGIAYNLAGLQREHGIPPEEVLLMIIVDGKDEMDESTASLFGRLGLYDEDLVIDEVEVAGVADAPEMENRRGVEGKPVAALDTPKGRIVTMHIFERSVPLPRNEALRRYFPPVPMLLAIKSFNAGRRSSHFWLLEGVCRQLHPAYVAMFDTGVMPNEDALTRLVRMMERSPDVGGCTGQIIPKSFRIWRPMEGAHHFDLKLHYQLRKSAEASIGLMSTMTNSFAAYRWEALRGLPLERYLSLEASTPSTISPGMASVLMAEDSVLGMEVVAQKEQSWILAFDPNAKAYRDVPQSMNYMIHHRRRFANEEFAAAWYYVFSLFRILFARHSIIRKIFFIIHAFHSFITIIITWFDAGALFLGYVAVLGTMLARGGASSAVAEGVMLAAVSVYMVLFTITCILALAGDILYLKRSYETLTVVWAGMMFIILTLACFISFTQQYYQLIVLIVLASVFGIWMCGSIIHCEPVRTFMWLPHYILSLPAIVTTITSYSVSRVNDTSWATRPGHSNTLLVANRRREAALAREEARRLGYAIRELAITTRDHLRRHTAPGGDLSSAAESSIAESAQDSEMLAAMDSIIEREEKGITDSQQASSAANSSDYHGKSDRRRMASGTGARRSRHVRGSMSDADSMFDGGDNGISRRRSHGYGKHGGDYHDDEEEDDASSFMSGSRYEYHAARGKPSRWESDSDDDSDVSSVITTSQALLESARRVDHSVHSAGSLQRRFREDLQAYLAAIRRAEVVRASRLRAAEEADEEATARDYDKERLKVRFNNYRLRIALAWILSNLIVVALVFFFRGVDAFAFYAAFAVLFVNGLRLVGAIYFQWTRFLAWLFRYLFFPRCYIRDDRFDPAKYRCCWRPESYYDTDVEWSENVRYVRPIHAGTGLLVADKDEAESAFGSSHPPASEPHAYGGVTPTASEVDDGTSYISGTDASSVVSRDPRAHAHRQALLGSLSSEVRATNRNAARGGVYGDVKPRTYRTKE